MTDEGHSELGERAAEAQAKLNDYVGQAQKALNEAMEGVKGEGLDHAQADFRKAQESLGETVDQVREFTDQLTETARERPLATLLMVGAVSFALGYLLRR